MRNFGIMSDRQRLGGASTLPAATRASTPRESFTTERIDPDDRELTAWMFGLLCASPLLVLSIVIFYLAR